MKRIRHRDEFDSDSEQEADVSDEEELNILKEGEQPPEPVMNFDVSYVI